MEYPLYYTLEEAETLLPRVEEKIQRLRKIHKALEFLSSINIENEADNPDVDLIITRLNMKYYKRVYLYHKYLTELLTMGVIIKDIRLGIVDFYAKYEGRSIHLCWRIGEKEIKYWHEINEGFVGRQPIDILHQKHTL
ncbi:MAG TPA: DUF2203 domain-containing protein [Nanoarchaeota archaeon]|nr:DUF2203 domain-containing protein [Candidatus Woesearchaeota archaeon]HIH58391.1 DUF2203 domain-containing protein [Nanoarchaeota archaeon]HII14093.1 DUF2203 domain-containing protein [Nanoarchaeota archaeon]HIJ04733.1 DUF2203 domain-containing protein [Nanoarchaeota archaeon]